MNAKLAAHAFLAVLAGLIVIAGMSAIDTINSIRFADAPYAAMRDISGARIGRSVAGSVTMEESAPCDPTGGPAPYFRWEWEGGNIATTVPFINGVPFVGRKVIDPGIPVRVGIISSELPGNLPDGVSASMSLFVVCDRGDGRMRPYRLAPDILIPPKDGPLTFLP